MGFAVEPQTFEEYVEDNNTNKVNTETTTPVEEAKPTDEDKKEE